MAYYIHIGIFIYSYSYSYIHNYIYLKIHTEMANEIALHQNQVNINKIEKTNALLINSLIFQHMLSVFHMFGTLEILE